MKRAVIFGLGSYFKAYKKNLEAMFDIVAYTCNSNVGGEHQETGRFQPVSELNGISYDVIVICAEAEDEIFHQLVDEMGVPTPKIRLLSQLFPGIGFEFRGVSYSEHYEDLIASLCLNHMGISNQNTRYLELGTNHPSRGNNTYLFYKEGARGYLVEANPELKSFIEYVRPDDILINKAVSLDNQKRVFHRLRQSGLGTLAADKLDFSAETTGALDVVNQYEVSCITIGEIIDQMDFVPDLFSIDVEGMDWEILHQINFTVWRPSVIVAETNPFGYSDHTREQFETFFFENGYRLIQNTIGNGIFVNQDRWIGMFMEYQPDRRSLEKNAI